MTTMGETVPAREFALLPETPIHWGTLCVSFLAQTLLVVLAAKINISLMAPVLYPVDTTESVHLVAPVFEPVTREPEKVARPRPEFGIIAGCWRYHLCRARRSCWSMTRTFY